MQITNEAADIINRILSDNTRESISKIEDAVQLNKEFNNQFCINTYFNGFNEEYCMGDTLYESMLIWGFNYFKEQLGGFNRYLTYGYYDYLYRHDDGELKEVFNMLSEEEQLKLYDNPVCKYYILYKFSLDIKI